MGFLVHAHHRNRQYFEPRPMGGTFALFATMVLAAAVVVFLGWLLTQ